MVLVKAENDSDKGPKSDRWNRLSRRRLGVSPGGYKKYITLDNRARRKDELR